MKKIIVAVLAAGLLLAPAASASAETIQRNGAKKATITAVSAPAGTETVKARITVKKGKKTVAKNKISYRAKKGKYKVTTRLTYRTVTPTTVQLPPVNTTVQTTADQITAECKIVSSEVAADRTVHRPDGFLDGTADVRHNGACTDLLSVRDANGAFIPVSWNASWIETGTICEKWDGIEPKNNVILRCTDFNQNGQIVNLVGSRLSALPTYTVTTPGAVVAGPPAYGPLVTVKSTRTVRVK